MAQLQSFFAGIVSMFSNLFYHPDWHNLVDVAILSVFIYQFIRLTIRTRANSLFKGILFILIITWASEILQLSALSWLLQQLLSTGIIVIVIVFQPELRRVLNQLGRTGWAKKLFASNRQQDTKKTEQQVSEIVRAMVNMSRKHIGALIVFERNTGLGDVIESGTVVNAEISDPLIENIFEPNTPLHDGAVVIRENKIVAAACILQLSNDNSISRDLGTRHRAAIGITEDTDAVSLIVSEETGIISMARDGRLTRHLDTRSLTILLTELMSPKRERLIWSSSVEDRLGAEASSFDEEQGGEDEDE